MHIFSRARADIPYMSKTACCHYYSNTMATATTLPYETNFTNNFAWEVLFFLAIMWFLGSVFSILVWGIGLTKYPQYQDKTTPEKDRRRTVCFQDGSSMLCAPYFSGFQLFYTFLSSAPQPVA